MNNQYEYSEKKEYLGAGIYCFYPFDSGLHKGKGVFKIGMTTTFQGRVGGYHTYFPMGMYFIARLSNPTKNKNEKEKLLDLKGDDGKKECQKIFYIRIERSIYADVLAHGGERVTMDERKYGGKTEWIYADQQVIFDAFSRAKKDFGGKTVFDDISNLPVRSEPGEVKPYFKGTINYY